MGKEDAHGTEGIPWVMLLSCFVSLIILILTKQINQKTYINGCHVYPDTSIPCFPSSNFHFSFLIKVLIKIFSNTTTTTLANQIYSLDYGN